MVKVLVLQQWHDASDVGMEEALQDRLSFRRFAEIRLEDAVPNHATFVPAVSDRKKLAKDQGRDVAFESAYLEGPARR